MEDELVQLDSVYAHPGFLLLAFDDDGERLGCVGARALEPSASGRGCEIRRLFVRGRARGTGLGRDLATTLVDRARSNGFDHLVLNTLPSMTEAISLYTAMGFNECAPYVDEPLDEVLYFRLRL